MRKLLVGLTIMSMMCIAWSCNWSAQKTSPEDSVSDQELIPKNDKTTSKWGYVDMLGNKAIPFRYENARKFSEGLAAVMLDGKWGYIDKTGKEVIPFKYETALPFQESLASVILNGQVMSINKTGIVRGVNEIVYDEIKGTSSLFALNDLPTKERRINFWIYVAICSVVFIIIRTIVLATENQILWWIFGIVCFIFGVFNTIQDKESWNYTSVYHMMVSGRHEWGPEAHFILLSVIMAVVISLFARLVGRIILSIFTRNK